MFLGKAIIPYHLIAEIQITVDCVAGSVEDVTHRKSLLKKANEELLAAGDAVNGRSLPGNE